MMRKLWRMAGILGVVGWVGVAAAADVPFRRVEARLQPPLPSGINVYSVKMTPIKTVEVPRLLFICTLRQEFQWRGSDGLEITRVIEPAVHTHLEENVRLTADLDRHISFRVDLRQENLVQTYGPRTFRPNNPVTVSRIRIEAQDASGSMLWQIEVPINQVTTFPQ